MATINEMRQVATQIENETQVGGNTASRVGGLFNDIVDKLEDVDGIAPLDNTPQIGSVKGVKSNGIAQVVYVDGFYRETEVDLSNFGKNAKFINSSGMWAQDSKATTPRSYAESSNIPVDGATKVRIKANAANGSIYAFLKSNTSVGSAADFCTGYGTRYVLSAGQEVEVSIPSDCMIFYIFRNTKDNDNFEPSELIFIEESAGNIPVNQVAKANQEDIGEINAELYGGDEREISFPSSLIRQNFINSSNVWNSNFSTYLMGRYRHVLLPVTGGTKYRLATASSIAIYAFLTGTEILGNPSFVNGYAQRYTINANSSEEITIPNGCNYLYLYSGTPEDHYLPTVTQLTNTTGLANGVTPKYRSFAYKKGVMQGDSISAGVCSYFYNNNRYNDFFESNNISDYIAALAGCQVDNIAKRGTGYVADTRNINNAWEMAQITDYSQYDFAILYYGVNDYIQGVNVGSLETNVENTIVGNMTRVFNKILTDNPLCKILCVGSYNCWGQVSVGGDYTSNVLYGDETTDYALGSAINGHTLQDILDIQKEVCEHYHVEFVNFAESGVVNSINIKNVLIDGLHPSFETRKLIASEIVKHL